jgi:hypothetical protein
VVHRPVPCSIAVIIYPWILLFASFFSNLQSFAVSVWCAPLLESFLLILGHPFSWDSLSYLQSLLFTVCSEENHILASYPRIPRMPEDQCGSAVISHAGPYVTGNDIAFEVEQVVCHYQLNPQSPVLDQKLQMNSFTVWDFICTHVSTL